MKNIDKYINKCPHCGCDTYYIKQSITGTIKYRLRYDGKDADNTEMYENISYTNISKYAWCNDCDKRLFKLN